MLILTFKKISSIILASSFLLTGCKESSPTSSDPSYSMLPAVYQDVTTNCAFYYQQFLKLGTLDDDSVSEELADATFDGSDEDNPVWAYDKDEMNRYSYTRSLETAISTYTVMFEIGAEDLSGWVDTEVKGLTELFAGNVKEESVDGATWAYSWEMYREVCKLQVYESGLPGINVAMLAFSRYGETGIPDNVVIDDTNGVV